MAGAANMSEEVVLLLSLLASYQVTSAANYTTAAALQTTSVPNAPTTQATATTAFSDNTTIIYTIGGNAGGDPCLFPFTFMGVSYSTCTTAGRSDNLKWCATTSNYAKDFIWGICPQPVDGCGEFWVEDQFGKYCYQFNFQSSLTWVQARDACRQQNAEMLSISSPKEQAWIAGRISVVTTVMWLGMSDLTIEGNWGWSDGSPLTYLNWREGQPNSYGGNEDCGAIITRNGLWGDTPCSRHLSFMCKKLDETNPANFVTTPQPINTTAIPGVDCYVDFGMNYRGSVSASATGAQCLEWSTQSNSYGLTGTSCRNPDHSQMPWCYTSNTTLPWGYCDIPNCRGMRYCKKGWKMISGRCYQLGCTIPSAWQKAQQMCKSKGATLARIANQNELNTLLVWLQKIQPLTNVDAIWLGLNDIAHEMMFVWDDKVTPTFTFWGKDQPDDVLGNSDCVQMRIADGRWNDVDCTTKLQYLCMQIPSESTKPDVALLDGTCFGRNNHDGHVTLPPTNTTRTTTAFQPTAGCPSGWVGFGVMCYRFEHDVLNWTMAYKLCKNRYGNTSSLLVPHDRYEQTYLSSFASKFPSSVSFHLNILALNHQSLGWHFFDTNMEKPLNSKSISFANWDRYQPNTNNVANNSIGMCVSMTAGSTAGLWAVANCKDQRRVACSLPREGVTPAPPPPSTAAPPDCPDGWKRLKSKCYKSFTQPYRKKRKTWTQARDHCQSLGGPGNAGNADLISIHSEGQLSLIKTTILPTWVPGPVWLGLNDRDTENRWQWSDGSAVDYIAWKKGEPNNGAGNENCVDYNTREKTWNDANCNRLRNWICQIDPGAVIQDLTNVTTVAPPTCGDPSWLFYNGSCYYFSDRKRKSYYDARQYCLSSGADLASIVDLNEQNFLHLSIQRLSLPEWWIGLDMNNKEQEYRWLDGTPVGFHFWGENEPNYVNKQESCASLYSDEGTWNDQNCGKVISFVCKRSNTSSASATTPTPDYHPAGFCPGDWWKYRGYCIKVMGSNITDRLNWTDARDDCMARGGNLLSIANAQQQAFLTSQLMNISVGPMWIGLNDMFGEGRFLWRDGTEYQFSNWKHGEPNSPGYRSKGVQEFAFGGSAWESPSRLSFVHRKLVWSGNRPKSFQDDCVAVVTEKWSVGKWADNICSENKAYICEMHKSVSLDKLCMDHPSPNWPQQCQEIVRDKSCYKVRRRSKKACMKSCNMCKRFVKPPRNVPRGNGLCTKGWRYWNNECWMLTKDSMSWNAAQDRCKSLGSNLATIADEFSQAWGFSMLSDPTENPDSTLPGGVTAWIGLKSDPSSKAVMYNWISSWPMLYSNWGSKQPNSNNGSMSGCVVMNGKTLQSMRRKGGYWYDVECNNTFPALCQQTTRKPPKNLTTFPGVCPAAWVPYKNSCYYFNSQTRMSTWYQADFECRKMGAVPVTIHSQEETDFVMSNAGSGRRGFLQLNVWVGLFREMSDDSYVWSDNSPLDFINWAPNQPSRGNGYHKELCTELTYPGGQWNDNSCNKVGISVCKMARIVNNMPATAPPRKAAQGGSDVGIAVGLTVVIVILLVLVVFLYLHKNRSTKSTYSLHLPSVSFRDFFSSSSMKPYSSADGDDRRGLVDANDDDGYH